MPGLRRVVWFYSPMIERDPFGTNLLVRNRGRIGTRGRGLGQEFGSEDEAQEVLEALARSKRRGLGSHV